jgi:hypothetical protein
MSDAQFCNTIHSLDIRSRAMTLPCTLYIYWCAVLQYNSLTGHSLPCNDLALLLNLSDEKLCKANLLLNLIIIAIIYYYFWLHITLPTYTAGCCFWPTLSTTLNTTSTSIHWTLLTHTAGCCFWLTLSTTLGTTSTSIHWTLLRHTAGCCSLTNLENLTGYLHSKDGPQRGRPTHVQVAVLGIDRRTTPPPLSAGSLYAGKGVKHFKRTSASKEVLLFFSFACRQAN